MAKIPVQLQGRKPITLDDKDYLSGGEGKVFVRGDTAYKIYHDVSKVIPQAKIQELAPIISSTILGPKELLYDPKSGKPIGFIMQFVANTIPLMKLFTTGFRDRNQVTPEMSVKLVQAMINNIDLIHKNDTLMVDGNECNYLVDGVTFVTPYFIDVDSYQTKSYPAQVQMPSIRDYHTKGFNTLSDWFSFAIIAAQIFVGVHPYRGSHPKFSGTNELEARMKANVSIFNKDTKLPPPARPFDLIPADIRDWFINLFEKGKRSLPPMLVVGKITKPQITVLIGSNQFIIAKEQTFKDTSLLHCKFLNGVLVAYTSKYIQIGKMKITNTFASVIRPMSSDKYLLVGLEQDYLTVRDANSGDDLCNGRNKIPADKKMVVDGRIYVIKDDRLSEIKVLSLGTSLIPSYGSTWNILPKASLVFRDVIYSDVLGVPFLYIPYKEGSMGIFKVDELKGYKILDAKHDNGVCILVCHQKKTGRDDRIIIKFNFEQNTYQCDIEKDITPTEVNFVTLDNGITVLLTGDDSVEVFHKSFGAPKKIIDKAGLDGSSVLFKDGNKVFFYIPSRNETYSFQMRK